MKYAFNFRNVSEMKIESIVVKIKVFHITELLFKDLGRYYTIIRDAAPAVGRTNKGKIKEG
jgi:hypothetical protein